MSYPFITANGDGNATAAFVSATQSSGLNITTLGAIAQLQLAVANLMLGEPPTGIVPAANVTAGTFGAGAFTFQGALAIGGALTGVTTLNMSGALTAGAISGTTVASSGQGRFNGASSIAGLGLSAAGPIYQETGAVGTNAFVMNSPGTGYGGLGVVGTNSWALGYTAAIGTGITAALTWTSAGAVTVASTLAVTGGFGCNGATPQTKTTLNAASTDLASVIALCNQIRTTIIANGQSQ